MTDNNGPPWTSYKFAREMTKAGWENRGQGWYVHERTKKEFYAWTYVQGIGEAWREWAAEKMTPPPF